MKASIAQQAIAGNLEIGASRSLQLCFQRIALGVFNRVDGQVNVEVGPVEMAGSRLLEPYDRLDRGSLEPRVLLEGQEQLSLINEKPEAVRRYVRYLSLQSFRRRTWSTVCSAKLACRSRSSPRPT